MLEVPVLVLGGAGKTGSRVAARLTATGRGVRLGSRRAAIPFDWERRDTWPAALRGVRAAYVSFQPDVAAPGALETLGAFFDLAMRAGVRKLVLLSGRGEVEALEAERALQATETDWTILRASWFDQNFSESFLLDPILAGEVALPAGLAAEPFVDAEDIADIAFAALTDARHAHQIYELTGPEAVSFEAAVAEVAAATGRAIAFVPVSPDDYRAELVRLGVPPVEVDLLMYLFTTVLDGRNTPVAGGVERALGRAPRSFADFARRTAATGVWGGKNG